MKAAILRDDRNIVIGEVPVPELGDDQVLIRVHRASICGTDLHIYLGAGIELSTPGRPDRYLKVLIRVIWRGC